MLVYTAYIYDTPVITDNTCIASITECYIISVCVMLSQMQTATSVSLNLADDIDSGLNSFIHWQVTVYLSPIQIDWHSDSQTHFCMTNGARMHIHSCEQPRLSSDYHSLVMDNVWVSTLVNSPPSHQHNFMFIYSVYTKEVRRFRHGDWWCYWHIN